MAPRFLRCDDVQHVVGVSKSTIYRWVKLGHFPRPLKIGPEDSPNASVGWRREDVERWLASRAET